MSFGPVVEELQGARTSLKRTTIAKSRRKVHANLYLFKMCMGNEALEPQDVLDLPHYHLVHDSTHPSVKEVILKCFISSSVYQSE